MARVIVITGPSGVGKGTLIRALRERMPELALSVSATTRERRRGEEEGRDYYFLDDEEFERLVADGAFVEHAGYTGRRYGTLRSELERHVASGRPVVLEIELQGARQVAQAMREALRIFIAPPDPAVLRERLVERGTDPPEAIERRLETARAELAARGEFEPNVVVNDDVERAVDELVALVSSAT